MYQTFISWWVIFVSSNFINNFNILTFRPAYFVGRIHQFSGQNFCQKNKCILENFQSHLILIRIPSERLKNSWLSHYHIFVWQSAGMSVSCIKKFMQLHVWQKLKSFMIATNFVNKGAVHRQLCLKSYPNYPSPIFFF